MIDCLLVIQKRTMISWSERFDDTSSKRGIKQPKPKGIEETRDLLPRCKRKRACVFSSRGDSVIREKIAHIATKKSKGAGAPADRQERAKAEKVKKVASHSVGVRPLATNLTSANFTSKDGAIEVRTVPSDIQNPASTFKRVPANVVTVAHLHM